MTRGRKNLLSIGALVGCALALRAGCPEDPTPERTQARPPGPADRPIAGPPAPPSGPVQADAPAVARGPIVTPVRASGPAAAPASAPAPEVPADTTAAASRPPETPATPVAGLPLPSATSEAPQDVSPAAGTELVPAILQLVANGVRRSDTFVYLAGPELYVESAALTDAGLRLASYEIEPIGGQPFVRLGGLAGVRSWHVDADALELSVVFDPERLAGNRVDLRRSVAPADLEHSQDTSAFVNYSVRASDLSRVDGFGELGFSWRRARVYSGVSLPFEQSPVRGLTYASVDLPRTMNRVVVGDAFASGGSLGGGAFLGGVQLSRVYELDPYFVPGPSLDQQTSVLSPSTLEVYVNGQLTHRQEVQPGSLDIANIPATAGAGDTRILLRDAMGREQVVTASYYRPQGLLAPGEQEYTYTAGVQRAAVGTESWSYGVPGAIGVHRVGLTPSLTAGARAEAATDRASGGLHGVAGVGIGQVELAGGASVHEGDAGSAASLAYAYTGRRLGVSMWTRYMSDSYATLGLDSDRDRARVDSGASIGLPIHARFTTSLSYAVSAMRDTGVNQRASISGGLQLPRNLQLSVSGSWSRAQADDDAFGAYASLTALFAPRMTGQVGGEVAADAQDATAEVQRTLPAGDGIGFRVGGRAGDHDRAHGFVDGQARFGRAHASYEWQETAQSNAFGVSGGLVAIGGRVFASRPVDSSYALVRVPDVKGVRAFLNNNEIGRTDRRGDLIVTGLLPYYGNRLSIADVDVPLDREIGATERVVGPPPLSGAVVEFPVTVARLVRGRLDASGVAYGELRIETGDGPVTSPIGSDGRFELENLPPGAWAADVRFPAGSCVAMLEVPVSISGPILDVGALPCELPLRVVHK